MSKVMFADRLQKQQEILLAISENFELWEKITTNPKKFYCEKVGMVSSSIQIEPLVYSDPLSYYLVIPYLDYSIEEEIAALDKVTDELESIAKFYIRVLQEKNFLQQLKENPKQHLKLIDQSINWDSMNVKIFEEAIDKRYILLPGQEDEELTEEDLQTIAAGSNSSSSSIKSNGGVSLC